MAPDLLQQFGAILRDDSLDNVRASEQLAELAQTYRGLSSGDKTSVYDHPSEDLRGFVDAIFRRLELLESEEHIADIETQGHLMTAVLKFMAQPIPDELAATLFERGFQDILCGVMDIVFQLEDIQDNQDSQTLIVLILQTLADLAEAKVPASGPTQRNRSGQGIVGAAALPVLVKNLPATKGMRVNVRRSSSSLLLSLLIGNPVNQRLIGDDIPTLAVLFDDFLRTCGDFPTQVDLLETLYRCCKSGLRNLAGEFIQDAQAKKRFVELLSKSSKSIDLAKELRELLSLINTAEDRPSVHSFPAKSIEYSIPDLVRPADMWVDVGDQQITLSAQIMDQETSPGDWDQIPEEPLDFEFKHIKRAHVADSEDDPSMCVVDITMIQNPDSLLEDYPALAARPVSVVLRARKDVAAPLLECLHKFIVVNVASQDPAFLPLSQSQQQRTVRGNKMSMGLTVYQHTRPATSLQPSSLRHDPAAVKSAATTTMHTVQEVSAVVAVTTTTTNAPTNGPGQVTPMPSLPGVPALVPSAAANGDLRATTPEQEQRLEQVAAGAADAVRAIALEAANAAIAAQGDARAIVHAEATVITATDGPVGNGLPASAVAVDSAQDEPAGEPQPEHDAAGYDGDDDGPGIEGGAQQEEDRQPAAKAPAQKGKGKAATAAAKNRSTGSRGAGPSRGKAAAADKTPLADAGPAGKRKAAGRKAPLSPLDVVARDQAKDSAAAAAQQPAAGGDDAGAALARLESSPEWLKMATAALPMAGSRGRVNTSVDHSLDDEQPASPRPFKSRHKALSADETAAEPAGDGHHADANGGGRGAAERDPYELRDSQEDAAAAAPAGNLPAGCGTLGTKSFGQRRASPKKPAGRLAALGITSPRKGRMPVAAAASRQTAPPAAGAAGPSAARPAATAAVTTSGSRDSEATKEHAARPASTGNATAGKSAAPPLPRSRTGNKPGKAPLPPGAKPAPAAANKKATAAAAGGHRTKTTNASPADSIENDASLPPLPKGGVKGVKGGKQRGNGAAVLQATLESLDTIEDPDSSFPDKPGQRSQTGPLKGAKGGKRVAELPVVAGVGKRPRREASTKAAQAIRDQAIADSPNRTRQEAIKRASGAAAAVAAAAQPAAPAAPPRVSPAPSPSPAANGINGHDMGGPSMYDFNDEEDHMLDDFVPPQRTIKPTPPKAKTAAAAKRAAPAARAAPGRTTKPSAAAASRKPSPVPEITAVEDDVEHEEAQRPADVAAAAVPQRSPAPTQAAAQASHRDAPSALRGAAAAAPQAPERAAAASTLRRHFAELDREELLAEDAQEASDEEPAAPAAAADHADEGVYDHNLDNGEPDAPLFGERPAAHREGSGRTEGRAVPAASGLTDRGGARQQPSASRPSVLGLIGRSPRGAQPLPVHKSPLPIGAPLLPSKKQLAAQQRRRKTTSGAQPMPLAAAPAPSAPGSVSRAAKTTTAAAASAKHTTLEALAAAKFGLPHRAPTPPVESEPGDDFGAGYDDGDHEQGGYEDEEPAVAATLAPERPAGLKLPSLQLPSLRGVDTQAAAAGRGSADDAGLLGLGGGKGGMAGALRALAGLGTEPEQEEQPSFKLPELRLGLPTQRAGRAGAAGGGGGGKRTLPQLTLPSLAGPSAPSNKRRKTTGDLGSLAAQPAVLGSLGEPDSQAQRLAQLLKATMAGDSEEGEDDDGLLTIILQTFTKKRQEAKARKAAILEDAKNKVTQAAAELDARLNKEARAQAGLVSRTLNTLDQELQSKYEAMFTLQEHFNARMQAAWDEYVNVYNSMETAKQELARMAATRTAAAQRQISELRQQSDAILRDAMQRAEKEEKHARKLQNLPQLLQGVLGA